MAAVTSWLLGGCICSWRMMSRPGVQPPQGGRHRGGHVHKVFSDAACSCRAVSWPGVHQPEGGRHRGGCGDVRGMHAHAAWCGGQVYNYRKEGAIEVAAASAADASERARAAAAAAAQAIHGLGPGASVFTWELVLQCEIGCVGCVTWVMGNYPVCGVIATCGCCF